MEPNCLSYRNAFKFFDGECECIYEPEVFYGKRKKGNDCCEKYDAVDETAYEERVAEIANEIYNQPEYDGKPFVL